MESEQPIPSWSLLAPYAQRPHYADCFCMVASGEVTIEQWAAAFFTSNAFRLERFVLNLAFADRATNATAQALAEGRAQAFSAWTVELRGAGQVLLKSGITRTWLAVAPGDSGGPGGPGGPDSAGDHDFGATNGTTQLYLGSAVLGAHERSLGARLMRSTLGIHRAYSQALLRSAKRNLR